MLVGCDDMKIRNGSLAILLPCPRFATFEVNDIWGQSGLTLGAWKGVCTVKADPNSTYLKGTGVS